MADRAKWDNDQLRSLLSELDDAVSLPGMDNVALERLLADQDAAEVPAEPLLPIVPRPGEEYNYVVVVAKTDMDNAWLAETMGLVSMASYKAKRTGVSRVIDVEHLKAAINRAIERGQTL